MTSSPGRSPQLAVGENVQIGSEVHLGAFVVIYDGVQIGDGCVIQDGAILGKPPQLGPHSRAPEPVPARLVLEPGVTVCCHAVICAGARIGRGSVVGEHTFIREGARLGSETVLGQATAVGRDARIGDRVRFQNQVLIAPESVVEDDVFFGPAVVVTNDLTMGRSAQLDVEICGVHARRACRVGANVVLLPGIELGEECAVAAGAVVTRSVAPRTLVGGVPARVLRRVEPREELEAE